MSEEQETNPIEDLIQAAISQDFSAASDIFNNVMGEKMADALDQEKIGIANSIYNGVEPEEDDYEFEDDEVDQQDDADLELEDEEIEEDDEVEN